jgi:hypothetical protein
MKPTHSGTASTLWRYGHVIQHHLILIDQFIRSSETVSSNAAVVKRVGEGCTFEPSG